MRRLLTVVAALAVLALLPATAAADTTTATSGTVTATLTYTTDKYDRHLIKSIAVARSGVTVYDARADDAKECSVECLFYGKPEADYPLVVRDIDGDAEPEVILNLFSGGAHCCTTALVLAFDTTGNTYKRTDIAFGDPGYVLSDLNGDGKVEFQSADYRFAYQFTGFAFSAFPLQIWNFDHGTVANTTRQFPELIKKDAKSLFKYYRGAIKNGKLKKDNDVRGLLAAWVADQYLLGKGKTARRQLTKARRNGWLRGTSGRRGSHYVAYLLKFLKKYGYR